MTKAELKALYQAERVTYESGERHTNEYALHLDTMLSDYFGLPYPERPDEDPDFGT
jgi:hypothetical protein